MTERDGLAALLLRAIQSSPEEPFTMPGSSPSLREVCVDGWVDFVHVADVLIAAGWRAQIGNVIKVKPGHVMFNGRELPLRDAQGHHTVDTRYMFAPWGEDGQMIQTGSAHVECSCGWDIGCRNEDVNKNITEHLFDLDH